MPAAPVPPANPATPTPDPTAIFDRAAALASLDGSEDYLRLLVDTFLDSAAKDMAVIRAAHQSGDLPALQRAAHSLKGASGYLHAHTFQRVIAFIDLQARTGDAEAVARSLPRLERAFAELQPLLEAARATPPEAH